MSCLEHLRKDLSLSGLDWPLTPYCLSMSMYVSLKKLSTSVDVGNSLQIDHHK